MTPQEISGYIDNLKDHFKELEQRLSDPSIYSKPLVAKAVAQEHRKLDNLFKDFTAWESALTEIDQNKLMLQEEDDEELKEMASAELEDLELKAEKLESSIQLALLPPDPNDARNIIVEIRPAAGGDEAALFAGELLRLYTHYSENKGWKLEILDQTASDLGGIKSVAFSLSGDSVYSRMKYESGVHRVQRVPTTESGGRTHTSTVTVSVMPEAEEVELNLDPSELRIDVFRASGPGGQCVNTTDSADRITHEPTGVCVVSQQEKSQHRNREIAMRILCARLLEVKQQEEADKQAANKRSQVGTGDRSERIRTYNYPQNRVTDHRYNITLYHLPRVLEGELDILLDPIISIDCERQLEALNK
jgi:peptide chain release factor 1